MTTPKQPPRPPSTDTHERLKLLTMEREALNNLRQWALTVDDSASAEGERFARELLCVEDVLDAAGVDLKNRGERAPEPYTLAERVQVLVRERDRARDDLSKLREAHVATVAENRQLRADDAPVAVVPPTSAHTRDPGDAS